MCRMYHSPLVVNAEAATLQLYSICHCSRSFVVKFTLLETILVAFIKIFVCNIYKIVT